MNPFDEGFLIRHRFNFYIHISDYNGRKDSLSGIPDIKGLYLVICDSSFKKDFLTDGTGGHFKGKNPNVSIAELEENWVDGTGILYIGKAGGVDYNGRISNATLIERIEAYLKFGNMKKAPHWGGRYIWQLKESMQLRIYWRICSQEENPAKMEKEIIFEFERQYGRLPYANLRH